MAGADVFRVNCSHSSPEAVSALIRRVHEAAPHAAVLVDLQGPKLRTHDTELDLAQGSLVTLAHHTRPQATTAAAHVALGFDPIALGVLPSQRLLINDGRIELVVEDSAEGVLLARVVIGGHVSKRKGVNLPDTQVTASPITPKDELDARAAVRAGADWIALSFVQAPTDIDDLRLITGDDVKLLAKVERPQILPYLSELCQRADGVMAARGDLGVEVPFELVPSIQREIAHTALLHGTVSVCATEMLESMVSSSRPTRAETNDVATAVGEGFDAVMLSAETATGADPRNAVAVMARICATYERRDPQPVFANANPQRAAVTAACAGLASRLQASHIVALTTSGHSAGLLAACRPPASIIAVTPSQRAARQLQLRWGVTPTVLTRPREMSQAADLALEHLSAAGLVRSGETLVLCASRSSPRSDADTVWVVTVP
jgi:pyruvate kinase